MKRALIITLIVAGLVMAFFGKRVWYRAIRMLHGDRTVTEVLAEVGEQARERLQPYLSELGIGGLEGRLALIAIKESKALEVWTEVNSKPRLLRTYPVLGMSGGPGPKLREGDKQVPEGIYRIESLNPNSRFHLSMRLNYPNAFDQYWAVQESRGEPGTDIFIHGKTASVGCLAMGDLAIEEIFTMVADVGCDSVVVLIAPNDPRVAPLTHSADWGWGTTLYAELTREIGYYQEAD